MIRMWSLVEMMRRHANDGKEREKSLEEVFRHASCSTAAKQFVSATLTTLFNPISLKKQSESNRPEDGGEIDSKNNSSVDDSSTNRRRRRRKRRLRRQNKKGRNLVACDDFVAVLNSAREAGAILPEPDELQAVSQRLANRLSRSKRGAAPQEDSFDSCLDLEEWALCYPETPRRSYAGHALSQVCKNAVF